MATARYIWRFSAAALPSIPHLAVSLTDPIIAAILAAVCYAPLLSLICGAIPRPRTVMLGLLGLLHGATLTLVGALWVWTFRDLPTAVPTLVALLAGAYYAFVFIVGERIAWALSRFAPERTRVSVRFVLVAVLLASGETLRSTSPDFPLPLANVALTFSPSQFLPVAALAGIPLLGAMVLLGNAAVALAVASHASGRLAAARISAVLCAILVTAHLAAAPPEPKTQLVTIHRELGTLCAYSDRTRRDRPNGGYLTTDKLEPLIDAATGAGCDLIVFPEVTSYVARRGPNVPVLETRPDIVIGVRIVDRLTENGPFVSDRSTNSICTVSVAEGALNCLAQVDKRFLTPFVETELFHRINWLRPFGRWVTEVVTGDGNTDTVSRAGTVLDLTVGRQIGVMVCVELFVPLQHPHDAGGQPKRVPLIVAPMDHSYFAPWRWMRTLKRRAAGLQAAAMGTPVLVVSTEDVALIASNGRSIAPSEVEGELYIWRSPVKM